MSTEARAESATHLRLSGRQRLILCLLLGAQFMFALDFSIVTVALPVIGADLAMDAAALSWIVTLFALSAAGLMLLMGRIGDYYGRRRLFLIGMALLTIGSIIGGFAQDPAWVYTARVIQGVATAVTAPSALALLTTSFPEGPLRNKALGLNGALLSLGFAVGAVLGGVLTDLLGWRFTFFINVPVGLVVLALAPFMLKESSEPTRQRLDVPGAVTVSLSLLALVLGLSTGEQAGWGEPKVWGCLVAAAVLAVAFWVIESKSSHPLAAVNILKRPSVALGNLGGLVTFSMESGKVFLLTIYLQQVLGTSAMLTGAAFAVLGAGAFTGGMVSSRIIDRVGARKTLVFGLTLQGVTTLTFLLLGHSSGVGYSHILVATAIGGFGHVLAIVSYTVAVTSGLPDAEQGLASGLTAMTQQTAFTLGTPVLAAVAVAGGVVAGASANEVLGGVHTGLRVNGLIVLVAAGIIAALYRAPRPEAAAAPSVRSATGSTVAAPDVAVGQASAECESVR